MKALNIKALNIKSIRPSDVWNNQFVITWKDKATVSYIQSPKFKSWCRNYDYFRACLYCEGERCTRCAWFAKQEEEVTAW